MDLSLRRHLFAMLCVTGPNYLVNLFNLNVISIFMSWVIWSRSHQHWFIVLIIFLWGLFTECKGVNKHHNYLAGTWRVIRVLPTASLASDSNILTPQVGSLLLSMILLGLTSGSTEARTKEASPSAPRSCCTVCEDFHCVSCCYKDRHKSSEPAHRTEHIRDDAMIEDDVDWVPFAAALFTHLDTNSFPCSAASQTSSTPTSDSKVSVRRVVAACVRHWARVMNQSIVMNSQNLEILYRRRIQMLEDLHTRVTAWADATGAGAELAEVVGNLGLQIEQLKTFL